MNRLIAISAALLLAGCAAPLPQTAPTGMPAQVQAAEPQAGSHWRYAVHDGFTKLPRGTVESRVIAVKGDAVTVEVSTDGRESTEIYTRDGNWLRRPATNMQTFTYSPAYPAFAFPLAPGKTWRSRVMATDPADGRRFPVTVEGEVLGWERIKVPAGEFDALKVHRAAYLGYWEHNVRGDSKIEEYEWYAPALKQVARRETRSQYLSYLGSRPAGFLPVRGGGGDWDGGSGPRYVQDDWLIYELVSHSLR